MDTKQPLSLEQIHKGTVEVLKVIIRICEELNINYFLIFGSLLGAARHEGFIPWDDDLDIAMLRPEFEKFAAYCEKNEEALAPFALLSRKNRKGYPYAIPRFCDTRYRLEMEKVTNGGMGIFIDIYPLDGLGDDFFADGGARERQLTAFKNRMALGAELACYKKFYPSPRGFLRSVPKFAYYVYAKLFGAEYFLKKLESLQNLYPFDGCTRVGLNIWDDSFYIAEKWHYEDYELLPFEGVQVKVPKGYLQLLEATYGDWRQLPPEHERIGHHGYEIYPK